MSDDGRTRPAGSKARPTQVAFVAVVAGVTALVVCGFATAVVLRVVSPRTPPTATAEAPSVVPADPPLPSRPPAFATLPRLAVNPPATRPARAAAPAPVPPPAVASVASAAVPVPPSRLETVRTGRFTVGDELEQAVTVSRHSAYGVTGTIIPQAARYTITSRLTVTATRPDGRATVRQVIEAARLAEADDSLRAALADALKKSEGVAFEMAVGPDGTASDVRGLGDPVRVQEVPGFGGRSVRLWSVLDADAWRELGELTFFAPGPHTKAGGLRDRPVSHDWGPLGTWTGRTAYTTSGRADGVERYAFARFMTYHPAGAGADAALPVRLVAPRFTVHAAGGTIRYDPAADRVTAAEETFRVRGAATVVVAGQPVAVEMEETQRFEVHVQKPVGQTLIARPRQKKDSP